MSTHLPIETIKSEVVEAWKMGGCIVSAPPGSGKSTQLPLWGLDLPNQKIFLLIPKRIAVKLAANQLAKNLQQKVGQVVGYQLRNDNSFNDSTRIIVTSYGSFLQRMLNDPDSLANSTVIMDEFHERALDQDVCFTLIQEAMTLLDESISLIIMSATLELEQLKKSTGLPLITSPGFSYPIEIIYKKLAVDNHSEFAQFIEHIWQNTQSHILVFLPGLKEIRALDRRLNNAMPRLILHGQLDKTPDLSLLSSAPPTLILATNIAESSVTLANVHTVIDSGFERFATTHPITGISTLKSRRISQASATQRAGRAGRLGPGRAFRLWSEEEHQSKVPYQPAEITHADLTQSILQLALWGTRFDQASWLTSPDQNRVQAAQQKCEQWNALRNGQITEHGKAILRTGLEPTLANFVVNAQRYDCLPAAIVFAATLSIDPARSAKSMQSTLLPENREIRKEAQRLAARLSVTLPTHYEALNPIPLIQAFQHRLIFSPNLGAAKLFNGAAVSFVETVKSEWSLMLEGHQNERGIRVFQALPLETETVFEAITPTQRIDFKPGQRHEFWCSESLGNISLSQQPVSASNEDKVQAWAAYIERKGEAALPSNATLQKLKQRWNIAASTLADWPSWPNQHDWLTLALPFLSGLDALSQFDTTAAFNHWAGYERLSSLDQLCPSQWICSTGRAITLDYQAKNSKVVARLKLQEAFGLKQQPMVGQTLPITLELTAPNGRPVANVHDLPHFWQFIYPDVRKELRGRYAKHPWPENPLEFEATAKTKRQLGAT